MDKKVYIIGLNYKGWKDTIECLESIFRQKYKNYQVIVVDNNSEDGSYEYIKRWANGEFELFIPDENPLKSLVYPPIKKPLSIECLTGKKFEKTQCLIKNSLNIGEVEPTTSEPLILIQSTENLGYAGGNNLGIKYALSKNDFEYIWILNNDTVVREDTLQNLVKCAEEKGEKVNPLGSLLLYYNNPNLIQAVGGKFNIFVGAGSHVLANKPLTENIKRYIENVKIDYPIGASLFFNKKFLKEVGLFDERFFIYFEEIDICDRGRKKGYTPDICIDSILYHKEASTIDSITENSVFGDFYAMRNRIAYAKKHGKLRTALAYFSLLIAFINRLRRKEIDKAKNIIRIFLQGERCTFKDFGH